MSEYSIYTPVRSNLLRHVGSTFPKKERNRSDFSRRIISGFIEQNPEMINTIEGRIIAEELIWQDAGCPMFFSDTSELMDMLWRSKMDVRIEDLDLGNMPRAFSFAWPKHKIDGVQPIGCLIWWGIGQDWKDASIRMDREYFVHSDLTLRGSTPPDMRLGLHMSFCKEDIEAQRFGLKNSYYRASIPHDLFVSGLASGKDFEDTFKKYNSSALIGAMSLSPEETHIQYVTFKLAIRMLVYMKACPELIREGYPGGKNHKAFESRWDEFSPRVIGMPARMTADTHISPITHLRTWYFRSYPVRRNGTRKNGVVFVSSTVVNADVDPKTVVEGGQLG